MDTDQRHWLTVNRAPVLTLWAAVVAERLGFEWDEALTLGRAVAGLNAYAKGRSLGIFKPSSAAVKKRRKEAAEGDTLKVDLLGRAVPAVRTRAGLRALKDGKPASPESVARYLDRAFGEALTDTTGAMRQLARAYRPQDLHARAYALYERFRPEVPAGKRGWGAAGRLSLDRIRSLADT